MQPDVVAKTLAHVEDEWKAQAETYIQCELEESPKGMRRDCDDTPAAFGKSCATVVSAVVQGSNGDPKVMTEYMTDVCGQHIMVNLHESVCNSFAKTIISKLTASSYDNRMNFHSKPACDTFWVSFLSEQKALHQQELEQEKKEADAASKAEAEEKEKEEKEKKDRQEKAKVEAEKEAEKEVKEEAQAAEQRKQTEAMENATIEGDLKSKEDEVQAVEEAAEKEITEASKLEADVAEDERNMTQAIKEDTPSVGSPGTSSDKKSAQPAATKGA